MICMNNRHIHLFNFLISLKIGIFAHLSSSKMLLPHPRSKNFWYKKSSLKALNVCSNKKWIGGWDVCEIKWENILLIYLISSQKSYFCDNDAIYDIIMMQVSVRNDVIIKDIKSTRKICWITSLLYLLIRFHF